MFYSQTPNQIAALGFILIVVVFSVLELSRWKKPDLADMLTANQKGRRLIGMLLLLILSAMAYGGTYWPPPIPIVVPPNVRRLEMLYWLFFSLLTVFLPLIAFFEFKDSLRRASQLRREVYREIVTAPLEDLTKENDPTKKTLP
jgi:hypothetical protein